MTVMQIEAFAALATADQAWHEKNGNHPSEPAYVQHLAEWLINQGWVRIHAHDSHPGCAQRDQATRVIEAGMTSGGYPDEIASAVLVTLLNPTGEAKR